MPDNTLKQLEELLEALVRGIRNSSSFEKLDPDVRRAVLEILVLPKDKNNPGYEYAVKDKIKLATSIKGTDGSYNFLKALNALSKDPTLYKPAKDNDGNDINLKPDQLVLLETIVMSDDLNNYNAASNLRKNLLTFANQNKAPGNFSSREQLNILNPKRIPQRVKSESNKLAAFITYHSTEEGWDLSEQREEFTKHIRNGASIVQPIEIDGKKTTLMHYLIEKGQGHLASYLINVEEEQIKVPDSSNPGKFIEKRINFETDAEGNKLLDYEGYTITGRIEEEFINAREIADSDSHDYSDEEKYEAREKAEDFQLLALNLIRSGALKPADGKIFFANETLENLQKLDFERQSMGGLPHDELAKYLPKHEIIRIEISEINAENLAEKVSDIRRLMSETPLLTDERTQQLLQRKLIEIHKNAASSGNEEVKKQALSLLEESVNKTIEITIGLDEEGFLNSETAQQNLAKTEWGYVLALAAHDNDIEIVQHALSKKAFVNDVKPKIYNRGVITNVAYPLNDAIRNENKAMFDLLIENKAKPFFVDRTGFEPLSESSARPRNTIDLAAQAKDISYFKEVYKKNKNFTAETIYHLVFSANYHDDIDPNPHAISLDVLLEAENETLRNIDSFRFLDFAMQDYVDFVTYDGEDREKLKSAALKTFKNFLVTREYIRGDELGYFLSRNIGDIGLNAVYRLFPEVFYTITGNAEYVDITNFGIESDKGEPDFYKAAKDATLELRDLLENTPPEERNNLEVAREVEALISKGAVLSDIYFVDADPVHTVKEHGDGGIFASEIEYDFHTFVDIQKDEDLAKYKNNPNLLIKDFAENQRSKYPGNPGAADEARSYLADVFEAQNKMSNLGDELKARFGEASAVAKIVNFSRSAPPRNEIEASIIENDIIIKNILNSSDLTKLQRDAQVRSYLDNTRGLGVGGRGINPWLHREINEIESSKNPAKNLAKFLDNKTVQPPFTVPPIIGNHFQDGKLVHGSIYDFIRPMHLNALAQTIDNHIRKFADPEITKSVYSDPTLFGRAVAATEFSPFSKDKNSNAALKLFIQKEGFSVDDKNALVALVMKRNHDGLELVVNSDKHISPENIEVLSKACFESIKTGRRLFPDVAAREFDIALKLGERLKKLASAPDASEQVKTSYAEYNIEMVNLLNDLDRSITSKQDSKWMLNDDFLNKLSEQAKDFETKILNSENTDPQIKRLAIKNAFKREVFLSEYKRLKESGQFAFDALPLASEIAEQRLQAAIQQLGEDGYQNLSNISQLQEAHKKAEEVRIANEELAKFAPKEPEKPKSKKPDQFNYDAGDLTPPAIQPTGKSLKELIFKAFENPEECFLGHGVEKMVFKFKGEDGKFYTFSVDFPPAGPGEDGLGMELLSRGTKLPAEEAVYIAANLLGNENFTLKSPPIVFSENFGQPILQTEGGEVRIGKYIGGKLLSDFVDNDITREEFEIFLKAQQMSDKELIDYTGRNPKEVEILEKVINQKEAGYNKILKILADLPPETYRDFALNLKELRDAGYWIDANNMGNFMLVEFDENGNKLPHPKLVALDVQKIFYGFQPDFIDVINKMTGGNAGPETKTFIEKLHKAVIDAKVACSPRAFPGFTRTALMEIGFDYTTALRMAGELIEVPIPASHNITSNQLNDEIKFDEKGGAEKLTQAAQSYETQQQFVKGKFNNISDRENAGGIQYKHALPGDMVVSSNMLRVPTAELKNGPLVFITAEDDTRALINVDLPTIDDLSKGNNEYLQYAVEKHLYEIQAAIPARKPDGTPNKLSISIVLPETGLNPELQGMQDKFVTKLSLGFASLPNNEDFSIKISKERPTIGLDYPIYYKLNAGGSSYSPADYDTDFIRQKTAEENLLTKPENYNGDILRKVYDSKDFTEFDNVERSRAARAKEMMPLTSPDNIFTRIASAIEKKIGNDDLKQKALSIAEQYRKDAGKYSDQLPYSIEVKYLNDVITELRNAGIKDEKFFAEIQKVNRSVSVDEIDVKDIKKQVEELSEAEQKRFQQLYDLTGDPARFSIGEGGHLVYVYMPRDPKNSAEGKPEIYDSPQPDRIPVIVLDLERLNNREYKFSTYKKLDDLYRQALPFYEGKPTQALEGLNRIFETPVKFVEKITTQSQNRLAEIEKSKTEKPYLERLEKARNYLAFELLKRPEHMANSMLNGNTFYETYFSYPTTRATYYQSSNTLLTPGFSELLMFGHEKYHQFDFKYAELISPDGKTKFSDTKNWSDAVDKSLNENSVRNFILLNHLEGGAYDRETYYLEAFAMVGMHYDHYEASYADYASKTTTPTTREDYINTRMLRDFPDLWPVFQSEVLTKIHNSANDLGKKVNLLEKIIELDDYTKPFDVKILDGKLKLAASERGHLGLVVDIEKLDFDDAMSVKRALFKNGIRFYYVDESSQIMVAPDDFQKATDVLRNNQINGRSLGYTIPDIESTKNHVWNFINVGNNPQFPGLMSFAVLSPDQDIEKIAKTYREVGFDVVIVDNPKEKGKQQLVIYNDNDRLTGFLTDVKEGTKPPHEIIIDNFARRFGEDVKKYGQGFGDLRVETDYEQVPKTLRDKIRSQITLGNYVGQGQQRYLFKISLGGQEYKLSIEISSENIEKLRNIDKESGLTPAERDAKKILVLRESFDKLAKEGEMNSFPDVLPGNFGETVFKVTPRNSAIPVGITLNNHLPGTDLLTYRRDIAGYERYYKEIASLDQKSFDDFAIKMNQLLKAGYWFDVADKNIIYDKATHSLTPIDLKKIDSIPPLYPDFHRILTALIDGENKPEAKIIAEKLINSVITHQVYCLDPAEKGRMQNLVERLKNLGIDNAEEKVKALSEIPRITPDPKTIEPDKTAKVSMEEDHGEAAKKLNAAREHQKTTSTQYAETTKKEIEDGVKPLPEFKSEGVDQKLKDGAGFDKEKPGGGGDDKQPPFTPTPENPSGKFSLYENEAGDKAFDRLNKAMVLMDLGKYFVMMNDNNPSNDDEAQIYLQKAQIATFTQTAMQVAGYYAGQNGFDQKVAGSIANIAKVYNGFGSELIQKTVAERLQKLPVFNMLATSYGYTMTYVNGNESAKENAKMQGGLELLITAVSNSAILPEISNMGYRLYTGEGDPSMTEMLAKDVVTDMVLVPGYRAVIDKAVYAPPYLNFKATGEVGTSLDLSITPFNNGKVNDPSLPVETDRKNTGEPLLITLPVLPDFSKIPSLEEKLNEDEKLLLKKVCIESYKKSDLYKDKSSEELEKMFEELNDREKAERGFLYLREKTAAVEIIKTGRPALREKLKEFLYEDTEIRIQAERANKAIQAFNNSYAEQQAFWQSRNLGDQVTIAVPAYLGEFKEPEIPADLLKNCKDEIKHKFILSGTKPEEITDDIIAQYLQGLTYTEKMEMIRSNIDRRMLDTYDAFMEQSKGIKFNKRLDEFYFEKNEELFQNATSDQQSAMNSNSIYVDYITSPTSGHNAYNAQIQGLVIGAGTQGGLQESRKQISGYRDVVGIQRAIEDMTKVNAAINSIVEEYDEINRLYKENAKKTGKEVNEGKLLTLPQDKLAEMREKQKTLFKMREELLKEYKNPKYDEDSNQTSQWEARLQEMQSQLKDQLERINGIQKEILQMLGEESQAKGKNIRNELRAAEKLNQEKSRADKNTGSGVKIEVPDKEYWLRKIMNNEMTTEDISKFNSQEDTKRQNRDRNPKNIPTVLELLEHANKPENKNKALNSQLLEKLEFWPFNELDIQKIQAEYQKYMGTLNSQSQPFRVPVWNSLKSRTFGAVEGVINDAQGLAEVVPQPVQEFKALDIIDKTPVQLQQMQITKGSRVVVTEANLPELPAIVQSLNTQKVSLVQVDLGEKDLGFVEGEGFDNKEVTNAIKGLVGVTDPNMAANISFSGTEENLAGMQVAITSVKDEMAQGMVGIVGEQNNSISRDREDESKVIVPSKREDYTIGEWYEYLNSSLELLSNTDEKNKDSLLFAIVSDYKEFYGKYKSYIENGGNKDLDNDSKEDLVEFREFIASGILLSDVSYKAPVQNDVEDVAQETFYTPNPDSKKADSSTPPQLNITNLSGFIKFLTAVENTSDIKTNYNALLKEYITMSDGRGK